MEAVFDLLPAPAGAEARIERAMDVLMAGLQRCFVHRDTCQLARVGWRLWVDGLPSPEHQAVAQGLCWEMDKRGIREVTLQRDVTAREVLAFLSLLREPLGLLAHQGGACRVFLGRQAPNLRLVGEAPEPARGGAPPPSVARSAATPEGRLEAELTQGFLDRSLEAQRALLREMVEGAFLEPLFHALERILEALAGPDEGRRGRAVALVRTLLGPDDRDLFPAEVLKPLSDGLRQALGFEGWSGAVELVAGARAMARR